MTLTFGQPLFLLLLLSVPAFFFFGRRRLRWLPADVRKTAVVLRTIVVVLLVLALARPSIGQATQQLSVVFAVDVSDSIAEGRAQAEAFIQAARETMQPNDRLGIVQFGEDATIVQPLGGQPVAEPAPVTGTDQTDIAKALHLARSIFSDHGGKRIVLLTDGQENVGRAEEEARQAGLANIQIFTVPIAPPAQPEVLIEALDVPPALRAGETVDVGVIIQSTGETQARLGLWMDEKPLGVQEIQLREGANRFTVTLTASERGFHSFRAQLEILVPGADTLPQNNEAHAFTVVKDPGRVLAITTKPEDIQVLVQTLSAAGVTVEIQPPSFIPSRLTPMKQYDSMILANVPAQSLSLDQMKTISSFVQSLGRGLLVIGGDSSFSVGNYGGTPLADVLPVQMNVPGNLERGNVALLLIIDKSGSMDAREEGTTKIRMARDAAIQAVDVLDPNDQVGVTAFDTSSQWIVPIQRVGDGESQARIQDRISRIEASGGTEIYNALAAGFEAMAVTRARYKHIILLTDGRSLSNSNYDDLMNQMRAQKITLSTIAIGSDADVDLLQELAREGEGRYYFIENVRDIPRITIRETRIASGASAVEGTFQPKITAPSPILKSIAEAEVPQLGGYVVTSPKDNAQIIMTSDRNDPILAQWYYGLGRVVAFTSDASSKWAADWLTWPEFGRFWTQALRWTMRSPADPTMQISAVIEGKRVKLQVEAVDDEGIFQDLLDLRARVYAVGDDTGNEIPLQQTRPGRYESDFFVVETPGAYRVDVEQHEAGRVVRTETSGFVVPYPPEYRRIGLNHDLLARIAALTNGRAIVEPAEVFGRDAIFEGTDWTPIWPWLLAAALLLFPLDVAVRRLKLSPNVVRTQVWPFVWTNGIQSVGRRLTRAPIAAARRVARSVRRGAAGGA